MQRFTMLCLILGVLLAAPHCVGSTLAAETTDNTPVMVMTHMRPETHSTGCWLKSIYSEAFRRLGLKLEYAQVPAAQASVMSDFGTTDGELGRTESYGKKHPALIRVEEPHLIVNFCVYSKAKNLKGLDWVTLKRSRSIIGHERGIAKLSKELGNLPEGRVYVVNNKQNGLKMVAEGRLDFFITTEVAGDAFLHRYGLTDTVHKVGVLETHGAHAYLNIRHTELAARLSLVLKEMKSEGILKRYAEQCGMRY